MKARLINHFLSRYILFVSAILVFNFSEILAQEPGSITGKIVSEDRVPIDGASVQVVGTELGTTTDNKGEFFLSIIPGTYELVISFIGFEELIIGSLEIKAGDHITLNTTSLTESTLTLNEIIITPGQYSIMGETPLSRQTLGREVLSMSFAEDITRAVVRLPGVASNDFSSKFTIRGGEDDEVLFILDGMEFYEPFHQRDYSGGLFSIFDIGTIQGVDLLTGGFSAEYGNRESGVFNMVSQEPADNVQTNSLGLSVMNARAFSSGNLANNRLKYLVSLRKGMLDKALKLVGEEENIPTFYDMLGKLEFKANEKHSIAAYALIAGDRTAIRDIGDEGTEKHDTKYRNTYFWIGWKAAVTQRTFVRTLIYSGKIKHNRNAFTQKDEWSDKLIFDLTDKRSYSFEGLKQDWTFDISDKFILKSGLNVRKLRANYDYRSSLLDLRVNSAEIVVPYSNSVDEELSPDGEQTGVYVSAKTQVSSKLFFETGLRHDYTSYSNDNLISPRFGFGYAFSPRTILRGAWGHYYQPQFINNLDVNHEITDFDKAELSAHYVLGIEHNFSNGINFRIEGYYKDISRLSPNYQNILDPWELFPEARNDQIRLEYNGASSKGVEFFLKSALGSKISWWLSYALAKSEENVTNIDFDGLLDVQTGTLLRPNNQRHTIYLDLNYKPSAKWKFNISWQFYKGLPQTIYNYDFVELNGENGSELPLHFYSKHLEFRGLEYPAYHRMDWRINRNYQFSRSKMNIFLQIVNVYNRANLRKFDLDVQASGGGLISDGSGGYVYPHDDANWFGIIPIIGMSWEF